MTSALPSCLDVSLYQQHSGKERLTLEVKAMELYEFPNEIPIATRWAGSACALIVDVCCGGGALFFFFREKSGWGAGTWATDRYAELWQSEFATWC